MPPNLWYNWSFRLIDFNLHRLFSVPNLYFCKPLQTDLHFLSILACTIVAAKFDICALTVDGTCCCCVKLAALFYWDIYLTTLFIDLKENPVGSWIRSEVSFSRTGLQDKQEAVYWMCFSLKKKKRLWSFSTREAFKALMCFVCEWPFDLAVKSVLPVIASIDRQLYLKKQLPLCLTDPHPTLVQPGVVKRDC